MLLEGIDQFTIGEEVYAMPFLRGSNGSYAQYVCVPEQLAHRKPRNISMKEAGFPLASMTAYRATIAVSAIKGRRCNFIGGIGGGGGSFVVQFASHMKASKIFTIAKNEESARFIEEKLGIPHDNIVLYEGKSPEEL